VPAAARLLIVEDEESLRRLMGMLLVNAGHKLTLVRDGQEALDALEADRFDLVVTDLKMPRVGGMELVRRVREQWPELPVIVITAFGSIESAVEAMQAGAIDYITKPFEEEKLKLAIDRALRIHRILRENRLLRKEVASRWSLDSFITSSPAMRESLALARQVAQSHANVIVYGESGTGKELITRGIHNASPRGGGPFVAINCAAIADSLLESELFGHEKGSFTGAIERKPGKFELAEGGTLFLDEIGDLSASVQAKVLRAIEMREVQRVGGAKPISVDVRFIAATNKILQNEVDAGRFREDLFFRLNVFPIHLPPLRDRPEDILPLVEHFLESFCEQMGKRVPRIPSETRARLASDPWSGNVRELQNTIERAVILLQNGELKPELIRKTFGAPIRTPAEEAGPPGEFRLPQRGFSLEDHEKMLIRQALEKAGGKKAAAARLLGISRATLRYRMEKYGLTDAAAAQQAGRVASPNDPTGVRGAQGDDARRQGS
jgi:DNA-binding NtrC family response regulator